MKSDFLRHIVTSARSETGITVAAKSITTDHIDMQDGYVGPIVASAKSPAVASVDGTLSFEQSDTTSNGDFATIAAEGEFPGGRANQGVNPTGGKDTTAGEAINDALSVLPTKRYVRAKLTVKGAASANSVFEVVMLAQPQVDDVNR